MKSCCECCEVKVKDRNFVSERKVIQKVIGSNLKIVFFRQSSIYVCHVFVTLSLLPSSFIPDVFDFDWTVFAPSTCTRFIFTNICFWHRTKSQNVKRCYGPGYMRYRISTHAALSQNKSPRGPFRSCNTHSFTNVITRQQQTGQHLTFQAPDISPPAPCLPNVDTRTLEKGKKEAQFSPRARSLSQIYRDGDKEEWKDKALEVYSSQFHSNFFIYIYNNLVHCFISLSLSLSLSLSMISLFHFKNM